MSRRKKVVNILAIVLLLLGVGAYCAFQLFIHQDAMSFIESHFTHPVPAASLTAAALEAEQASLANMQRQIGEMGIWVGEARQSAQRENIANRKQEIQVLLGEMRPFFHQVDGLYDRVNARKKAFMDTYVPCRDGKGDVADLKQAFDKYQDEVASARKALTALKIPAGSQSAPELLQTLAGVLKIEDEVVIKDMGQVVQKVTAADNRPLDGKTIVAINRILSHAVSTEDDALQPYNEARAAFDKEHGTDAVRDLP
jgi:hypothetical protein